MCHKIALIEPARLALSYIFVKAHFLSPYLPDAPLWAIIILRRYLLASPVLHPNLRVRMRHVSASVAAGRPPAKQRHIAPTCSFSSNRENIAKRSDDQDRPHRRPRVRPGVESGQGLRRRRRVGYQGELLLFVVRRWPKIIVPFVC